MKFISLRQIYFNCCCCRRGRWWGMERIEGGGRLIVCHRKREEKKEFCFLKHWREYVPAVINAEILLFLLEDCRRPGGSHSSTKTLGKNEMALSTEQEEGELDWVNGGTGGHLPQHNPKPPKKQLSKLECMGNGEGWDRKGVSLWEWQV